MADLRSEDFPIDGQTRFGLRIAKDFAAVATGTALGSLFGTLVIFVIPRLVSVEDFGYWRIFLLYSGYVGFLHFGFIEGALLFWAGQPLSRIRQDLLPSIKFVGFLQALLFLIGAVLTLLFLHSSLWLVSLAVLAFAILQNVTTVLQYALQGAREFRVVAVAVSVPAGGFLVFAILGHLAHLSDYRMLIAAYLAGWTVLLIFLWYHLRPQSSASVVTADSVAWRFIGSGWPITVSNFAYGIVQSADKLVVCVTGSIYGFAQYSLAASVMAVPIAAIAAASRVFFPHLAAVDPEHHQATYGRAAKMAFLCWSLSIPYYFVLARVVPFLLPKYLEGLPYAKILLCGSVFLGSIQILQLSFSNIYKRQRQFVIWAGGAVSLSFLAAFTAAIQFHSLKAVAASQVVSLLIWWQVNEWNLRDISGQMWTDWAQLLFLFAWSASSLWLTLKVANGMILQIIVYYALTLVFVAWIGFAEISSCFSLVRAVLKRQRILKPRDSVQTPSASETLHCVPSSLQRLDSMDPPSA